MEFLEIKDTRIEIPSFVLSSVISTDGRKQMLNEVRTLKMLN